MIKVENILLFDEILTILLVQKISKQELQVFEDLKNVFSPNGNYKNYQNVLKEVRLPAIPYIPLYSKYLFAIDENNPTFTENSDSSKPKLLNFEKLRMLYVISAQMKKFQQSNYKFARTDNKVLSRLRKNLPALDEKLSYKMSLLIEPKNM